MAKIFNVAADCKPDKHYMVNLDKRVEAIKRLVDDGAYFTINRARQFGKTTTLKRILLGCCWNMRRIIIQAWMLI